MRATVGKLIFLFSIIALTTSAAQAGALQTESRKVIFSAGKDLDAYKTLTPGKHINIKAALSPRSDTVRRFLRVVGNVQWPAPWNLRGERNFRYVECLVDDNLDSTIHKNERYSLYFKGENDNFERHAYNRIMGQRLKAGPLTVRIPIVRKNALKVSDGGDFGVELQVYLKRPGRAPQDVFDKADLTLRVPIPEGSSKKYSVVDSQVQLPDNVACILLRVGGTLFSGECWIESPSLIQDGKVVWTHPFVKELARTEKQNYWVGINMSTKMWPKWLIEFNGIKVKDGYEFDRCSDIADFMIPLPQDVCGDGTFRLTLQNEEHRVSWPYSLRRVEVIEQSARDFEVAYLPTYVAANATFGILIETNKPAVSLKVESADASQLQLLKQPGLHVINLRAGDAGVPVNIKISSGHRSESLTVEHVIEKHGPQVLLSSGDEIYAPKEPHTYDYFFKWYLRSGVGNAYHFRPSYQWNGTREVTPQFVSRYTRVLNDMNIPYAWQVEGRNLAASRLNPSLDALAGQMFRGKQAHENDGGYYYWTQFRYVGLFSDIAARTRPYGGIFAKCRPIFTDHGDYIHYDRRKVTDMADGARYFVSNLRQSKGESTRHTGPSTLFRYFYQAGYDWLGAEQMYGPEEKIMSALRGASRAYSKPGYGSLHAMQWLRPYQFENKEHSLRFYLSLAVAYMHGSSHINTEEALWTDELLHDRYSTSGQEHMKAQNLMLEYISTHDRRGHMVVPTAIIQGRNDAWRSFGRGPIWEQDGQKWAFNKAMESFDVATSVYYPQNGNSDCGPDGWFSSEPFGAIDFLPIEAPQDVLNSYRLIAFMGWNTFDTSDFIRLKNYVMQGGTLVLTAAHINSNLQPDEQPEFPNDDAVIRQLLGQDYRSLTSKTERSLGLGRVIYFPQKLYPADEQIRADYEQTLRNISHQLSAEQDLKGWIQTPPDSKVSWTAWEHGDMRVIYLLNIDWKDCKDQTVTLLYRGKFLPVTVKPWQISTIYLSNGAMVITQDNTTHVISIDKTGDNKVNVKYQTAQPGASLQTAKVLMPLYLEPDKGIVTQKERIKTIFHKEPTPTIRQITL